MDRNEILIAILLGVFVVPALLFLASLFGSWFRDKRDMAPLHPQVVSLFLMICIVLSWLTTCTTVACTLLSR